MEIGRLGQIRKHVSGPLDEFYRVSDLIEEATTCGLGRQKLYLRNEQSAVQQSLV